MDCIGPLNPPSAQGHTHCLCIVDNCTRWHTECMLKSLTARSVYDALLDLFVNVGVPNVITGSGNEFYGAANQRNAQQIRLCSLIQYSRAS